MMRQPSDMRRAAAADSDEADADDASRHYYAICRDYLCRHDERRRQPMSAADAAALSECRLFIYAAER